MALSANAQVYVGGGLSIGGQKWDKGGKEVTTYKLIPEIGYNLNDKVGVGMAFGWQGATRSNAKAFSANPYVRYTFFRSGKVSVFLDGTIGYTYIYNTPVIEDVACDNASQIFIGVKPGVAFSMSDHFSLVAHIGTLGWGQTKLDWDGYSRKLSEWEIGVDGNNIALSLYYNF